jgi:hypothetical protein
MESGMGGLHSLIYIVGTGCVNCGDFLLGAGRISY